MKSSEEQAALYHALALARAAFKPMTKSKEATIRSEKGTYSYKYATLDECFASIDQALSDHDLALIGGIEYADDGGLWVLTRLVHGSGQWIENALYCGIPKDMKGAGSLITYARRYGVCLTVQIQAEDDDDGEHGETVEASKRQIKRPRVELQPETTDTRQDPIKELDHPERLMSNLPKPKPQEVDELFSVLGKVYGSDDAAWAVVMGVVHPKNGQAPVRRQLRFTMTRAEYDQLLTEANAVEEARTLNRDHQDDVPDFDGAPANQDAPDAAQVSNEAQETAIDSETSGEQGEVITSVGSDLSGTYATPQQMAQLQHLAQQVGDDAMVDVQDLMDHYAAGLSVEVYEIVWKRLKARKADKKPGAKVTTGG